MQARRRALATRYREQLSDVPGILLQAEAASSHEDSHHLFVVLIDRERCGMDRDAFRDELQSRNIGTGLHYPAVHRLAYYRGRYPQTKLPHTEDVAERILSLPLYPAMEDRDVDDVVGAIRDIVPA